MHHQAEKKLNNRLHILQGQLQALEKMLKQGKYCVDIIRLSLAVQILAKFQPRNAESSPARTCQPTIQKRAG